MYKREIQNRWIEATKDGLFICYWRSVFFPFSFSHALLQTIFQKKNVFSTYPIIRDSVIIIVGITCVASSVFVVVFLARVGKIRTVVL